jgi:predicted DNA binding protein
VEDGGVTDGYEYHRHPRACGTVPLGRILETHPDVEIELERLVPTREAIVPLFWVETGSEREVEETLRTDPLVEHLVRQTRASGRLLYSVTWNRDVDGLVRAIVDLGADVLSAEGTANVWEFRLQFRSRADLGRFRRTVRERGIDLDLLELYNPQIPPEKGPLTSEQHDVLVTTYERGYWDVPRETTQRELADFIGISENLLSRRLRDGVRLVVGEQLFGPGGRPGE